MSTEITINQDIVEINVTEEVVVIEAPSGAYPLPSMVSSVFGRTGNVVAQEGDYTLTQLGDVTITSPSTGQVLKYNGTTWVNGTDTDTGLTSVGLSMPSAFSVWVFTVPMFIYGWLGMFLGHLLIIFVAYYTFKQFQDIRRFRTDPNYHTPTRSRQNIYSSH